MRIFIVFTLVGIVEFLNAQNNSYYQSSNKKHSFTRQDWLELLSDISSDSAVMTQMKTYSGNPIVVYNKPYFCYVADSFPLQFQFCPECIWIVDSCNTLNTKYSSVSLKEVSDYRFVLKNIPSLNEWNRGDTVKQLFFIACCASPSKDVCYLTPIVSREWFGTYAIYPQKK